MNIFLNLLVGYAVFAALCLAGETRTWLQDDYSHFEKGVIQKLALRSDGILSLAPVFEERFDSSSPYLWALKQDSKGNLYAGGGPGAKLYRITRGGEKKTFAEWDALEIHAIAIDKDDRVYAATSPDGKVYRVTSEGKSEIFYEPKAKYIWAMAFGPKGDLYVATGDPGEIHRIPPNGKGSLFFKSDEMHMRSLAVDATRRGQPESLIVGTEPGGLVVRVSANGQGFVLHQTSKKEVTAVAVGSDGTIYAAGVGNKQAGSPPPPPPGPAPSSQAPQAASAAKVVVQARPAGPPPPTMAAAGAPPLIGGSEVVRISTDGHPRKAWSHAQEIVYSLALDSSNRLLLGCGNRGSIFRIESDTLYTTLPNAPPTQVTALEPGRNGHIYVATGNSGKVYQLGPGLEREGDIESDVFDAGMFSRWGRLVVEGSPEGGSIAVATRSGNLDRPQSNWSEWAAPASKGSRVTSPPARFLQWKATLKAGGAGSSPRVEYVEVAYLPKNVAPVIDTIQTTPPNYRFPATTVMTTSSQSITLPPLVKSKRPAPRPAPIEPGTPAMSLAKGYIGGRWTASDENGDALIYTLEIRGAKENEWKLLKDKVKEKYLSWDSTAFPDGEYRLRLTASDQPGNPQDSALSASLESDPFVIDNTPPVITGLAASRSGKDLMVTFQAADALNVIQKAEYSVNGGDWLPLEPKTGLSDALQLEYEFRIPDAAAGEQTIAVRVEDEYENQATGKIVAR
ncbi:MAG: hypothetical protein WD696_12910 [Bryobacteraceae bacterium]